MNKMLTEYQTAHAHLKTLVRYVDASSAQRPSQQSQPPQEAMATLLAASASGLQTPAISAQAVPQPSPINLMSSAAAGGLSTPSLDARFGGNMTPGFGNLFRDISYSNGVLGMGLDLEVNAFAAIHEEQGVQCIFVHSTSHGFPAYSATGEPLGLYRFDNASGMLHFTALSSFEDGASICAAARAELEAHRDAGSSKVVEKSAHVTLEKMKEHCLLVYFQSQADNFTN